jgi:predicted DNA-binding WGR domain protein
MKTVLLTLINDETNTCKYYRLELLPGFEIWTQNGRIGGARQERLKKFESEEAASLAFEKLLSEKLKKGYQRSEADQVPELKNDLCPYCADNGPQRLEGMIAIPYPLTRRL